MHSTVCTVLLTCLCAFVTFY